MASEEENSRNVHSERATRGRRSGKGRGNDRCAHLRSFSENDFIISSVSHSNRERPQGTVPETCYSRCFDCRQNPSIEHRYRSIGVHRVGDRTIDSANVPDVTLLQFYPFCFSHPTLQKITADSQESRTGIAIGSGEYFCEGGNRPR
jgi:hypothetical protein